MLVGDVAFVFFGVPLLQGFLSCGVLRTSIIELPSFQSITDYKENTSDSTAGMGANEIQGKAGNTSPAQIHPDQRGGAAGRPRVGVADRMFQTTNLIRGSVSRKGIGSRLNG